MDRPLLVYSKNRSSISRSLCHVAIEKDHQQINYSRMLMHTSSSCAQVFFILISIVGMKMQIQDFHCAINRPLSSYSSSLVFLSANVSTFDDCLCLLEGRLNQLSQLIVNIHSVNNSPFNIDDTLSRNGRLVSFEDY